MDSSGKKLQDKAWTRLMIIEQGGFSGVLRGAELLAHALDDARREQVSQCLAAVQALPAASRQLPVPGHADQQSVQLECHQAGECWSASFDRAHMPDAVSALLESVKLKPIAPR